MKKIFSKIQLSFIAVVILSFFVQPLSAQTKGIFNVKDFGAIAMESTTMQSDKD